MPRKDVTEQEDGTDFGPVRVMNPNARRFSIIDKPNPGPEKFNGKDITWLITFDVHKPAGETRQVPYKVKIVQRDSETVYVIKKDGQPTTLLNEDEVILGDPAVGITTK